MKARITKEDLRVGTKVYYTGDMANMPGTGTINSIRHNARFGDSYELAMENDDRNWWIELMSFQPGPGRRFWLLEEYEAERKLKMEESRKAMLKALGRTD